jgi:hypothetical protein
MFKIRTSIFFATMISVLLGYLMGFFSNMRIIKGDNNTISFDDNPNH